METAKYINEVWRPVVGYYGLYEVSNFGRVRSLPRNGTINKVRILKLWTVRYGYLKATLSKDNKVKAFSVHRLVAMAFLPNPNNLPFINHKDYNTSNNYVHVNEDGTVDPAKSNIEWCSVQYNNTYGDRLEKASWGCRKPILQFTNEDVFIKRWPGGGVQIHEELGYSRSQISSCCHGRIKTYKDCIWKFAD